MRCLGCAENGGRTSDISNGVVKKRVCTDVPWCCILVAYLALLGFVIVVPAIKEDHHERLMGATDYLAQTCGHDAAVKDLKLGAWPNLEYSTFVKCIDHCDETSPLFGYSSHKIGYWCVPDSDSTDYDKWEDEWTDQMPIRQMQDIYADRDVFGWASLISFGGVAVWLFLLFFCLRYVIYLAGASIIVGCSFGAYTFFTDPAQDYADFLFGSLCIFLGLATTCCLLCCWSSISDVIEVIEETSIVLFNLPELFFVPFITFPMVVLTFLTWIILLVLIFGAGEYQELPIPEALKDDLYNPTTDTKFYDFNADIKLHGEIWLTFIFIYWALQYVAYFNFLVISMAAADFYIKRTMQPGTGFRCMSTFCTLCTSFWRTLRYHLGTIAFASLIIAIVQAIETVVTYLDSKLEDATNPCAALAMSCIQCTMRCTECFLNKFNQGSLVITAIYGYSFCASCGSSISMIFSNIKSGAMGIGMISMLKMVGVLSITIFTTGIVANQFLGLDERSNINQMGDRFIPLLVVAIVAYFVCHICLTVWSSTALSVLVSFIILDEQAPEKTTKKIFTIDERKKPLLRGEMSADATALL